MSGAPSCPKPPAQRQFDATERRCGLLMTFALHHDGSRLAGMFLEPFRSRPAHIMQLGPVTIRQISHHEAPWLSPLRLDSSRFMKMMGARSLRMRLFPSALPGSLRQG